MSYDLEHMLSHATEVFLAGERSSTKISFGTYPEHSLHEISIVLYALSIEICVKLLLILGEKSGEAKGHNIRDMFFKLDDSVRNRIESNFPSFSGENLNNALISCGGKNTKNKSKSAFELWRYPYESANVVADVASLRCFFIGLYNTVKQISPNLSSALERKWGKLEFGSHCSFFDGMSSVELIGQGQTDQEIFDEVTSSAAINHE